MKNYELTYLISPDVSGEELKNLSAKINNFVKEEAGNLEKITEPSRKKLGYSIKKKGETFLAILNFSLNPEKLGNLEKKLKSENQILRYMISTKKIPKKVPGREISPKRLTISQKIIKPDKPTAHRPRAGKVELEDIDKKIEEILGE